MEVVLMAAYQADCAMDRGGAAFACWPGLSSLWPLTCGTGVLHTYALP
jgi:hypothetical protein